MMNEKVRDGWIGGCSEGWMPMNEWIDGYKLMGVTKNGWKNRWMEA